MLSRKSSNMQITAQGNEIYGQNVKDKIFVCPTGKGSSSGPIISYLAKKAGNAPKAMIITNIEPVLASAILTADIPAVDRLDQDPLEVIETGDFIKVDADQGLVEVIKRT